MSAAHQDPDYRSLALAAMFEALWEVHATAVGEPPGDIGHLLQPLFTVNAESMAEVFPAAKRHRRGVETAMSALAGNRSHLHIVKYAFSVVDLAARLQRNEAKAAQLRRLLQATPVGAASFTTFEADALRALADIYVQTVSSLGRRLQVSGNPEALQKPLAAARIRALLLAAVRFAWLWRQLGGRRWRLLAQRRQLWLNLDALRKQL